MSLLNNLVRRFLASAKSVKASSVQSLISMQSLGQAVWTDRKYAKFAEEGYKKNIVAFKAIRELITSAEQAPLDVQKFVDGTWQDDDTSELARLIARPNPQQSTSTFFGSLIGFYGIAGNSYIEAVRPSPGRPPKELYALRPDRMKVIPGAAGPVGYEYTVGAQTKKWSAVENSVRHVKTFNPLDDWYGMSPMEAAAYDIDIHTATLAWNKSLLDNGARPSGALVYAPKKENANDYLTDEQFKRLKQEMDEKMSGKTNAGRPILLEGGLQWMPFSLSPADMDYLNSKNTTARDICTAWGIPPQLLGIPGDNTYSNMKEARLALWEQTLLPMLGKFVDELNAWLAPQFTDAQYRIVLDEDDISALEPRREAKWKKLQDASFLTVNEKREALGYEEVDGGDVLYISATMVPIGSSPLDNPKPVSKPSQSEDT